MIKEFIIGIGQGIKQTIEFILLDGVRNLLGLVLIVSLAITVIIGHFTGNLGLVYMEKYEAIQSLIKLWILHTILALILFVITIIIIYIYQRSLQGETLDEYKEKKNETTI